MSELYLQFFPIGWFREYVSRLYLMAKQRQNCQAPKKLGQWWSNCRKTIFICLKTDRVFSSLILIITCYCELISYKHNICWIISLFLSKSSIYTNNLVFLLIIAFAFYHPRFAYCFFGCDMIFNVLCFCFF